MEHERGGNILLVCNQLYYPASCGPKGHGSEQWFLLFFPRIPFPTGVTRSNPWATMPSQWVFPLFFSPVHQKEKGKEKTKEKNILSGAHLGSLLLLPTSLLRHGLEPRFRLPLAPPPVAGAPEGVSSGVEGAAAPCILRGAEGDLCPSLRPCGPLACAHPFKFGWGML